MPRDLFVEILPRHLTGPPLLETFYTEIAQRVFAEILPRSLLPRELLIESLYRDFSKRSSPGISHKVLVQEAKRHLKEIWAERALVWSSCAQILPGDLLRRDLVKRAEAFLRDDS